MRTPLQQTPFVMDPEHSLAFVEYNAERFALIKYKVKRKMGYYILPKYYWN